MKHTVKSLLLSFWTLSIIRISTNQKTQRFGNRICFRIQARGGAPTIQKNQKLAFPQAMPQGMFWHRLWKGKLLVFPLPPRLKTETDPVSETLCFLFCRNPDDGQSPEA
jgi:hypothetical protein